MNVTLSQQLYRSYAMLVLADIADYRHAMHPAEQDLLVGMSEKRSCELSTGRYCAHQALHALGIDDFPILKGAQREPLWPQQVVGSISHCRDLAGAVVADAHRVKSIGLDIESQKQLNPAIARHICTDQEKAWLASHDAAQQNLALLLIFSIKEAIFKCVYQATHERLRFQQCDVVPNIASKIANVEIRLTGVPLHENEIDVRFWTTDSHIFTGALWHYLPAVG